MSQAYDTGLLGRRLDRLRAMGDGPSAARPARPVRSHASALATALGGTAEGSVVAIETQHDVPLDRTALGRLPVPVNPGRPLVCLDLETTGLATGPGTVSYTHLTLPTNREV